MVGARYLLRQAWSGARRLSGPAGPRSETSPSASRLMWEVGSCVFAVCFAAPLCLTPRARTQQAAKKPEFKLNLADLIKFGRDANKTTLLMSAMFLQKELPIRIGKRVQELQSLPVPMYSTKSVRELAALYEETFFRVINHEPPNHSKAEQDFSDMLLNIREKHKAVQVRLPSLVRSSPIQGWGSHFRPASCFRMKSPVSEATQNSPLRLCGREQANIAGGFSEMLRAGVPKWALESQEIQDKLTRFYTGRIGVRLLIDQHLGEARSPAPFTLHP